MQKLVGLELLDLSADADAGAGSRCRLGLDALMGLNRLGRRLTSLDRELDESLDARVQAWAGCVGAFGLHTKAEDARVRHVGGLGWTCRLRRECW